MMLTQEADDLVLDLASLKTGSNTGSFTIAMDRIDWHVEDSTPASPSGTLKLDVNYSERSVILRGTLDARFGTQCARCLGEAFFGIGEEISAIYAKDGSMDSDTAAFRIPKGGRLVSILDAVREAVILSVPGKPLCREDCRGICQVCGENLNENRCRHDGGPDAGCVR
jgi:uncharacterized protein